MDYSTNGKHIIVDAWGVSFDKLNDLVGLTQVMTDGANKSGATVLSVQSKQFEPNGVTVLIMLSESHFSIHTYPEKGFAGIDCYTCGDTVTPSVAIQELLNFLEPKRINPVTLIRGYELGIF